VNVAIDKLQSVPALVGKKLLGNGLCSYQNLRILILVLSALLQTWSRRLQSLKSEHVSKQMRISGTLDWMRHVDHALGPIKLRSGQTSMHWPFFVGANTFSRLHTNIMPSNPPPTSALLQLISFWTTGLENNHSFCPSALTVMLNGVTLKFGAVSFSIIYKFSSCLSLTLMQKLYNSVKAKSANINFAINAEGVMDISRLLVKGKNVLLVKRNNKTIEVNTISLSKCCYVSNILMSKHLGCTFVYRNIHRRKPGDCVCTCERALYS
jgi:hypothetical protein